MKKWRNDFGDYELLFPATEMGLGIVDVAFVIETEPMARLILVDLGTVSCYSR